MSLGLQLLCALILEDDLVTFAALPENLFVRAELPAYQAVKEHFDAYGVLPRTETLSGDYGISLGPSLNEKQLEPSSHYLRQLRSRQIYNTAQAHIQPMLESLKNRETDAMAEMAANLKNALDSVSSEQFTASSDELTRVEERMGVYSAADLQDMEFAPQINVVHGVIGSGLTLLIGDPKIGKSFLATELLWSVAEGTPALGGLPTIQGPVVYLALEDIAARFKERVERMGIGFSSSVRVSHVCRQLDKGGLQDIEKLIIGHRPSLLVIDTFAKIRRETNDRQPIQQREYKDLEGLKQLADQHDVAIVLVVHTNKSYAKDITRKTAGSHGFTGCADNLVLLSREGLEGTLKVLGRNVEENSFHLLGDRETNRWRISNTQEALEVTENQNRVYCHLRDHGPRSPGQIARELEMNRSTVRTALQGLRENYVIWSTGTTSDRVYHAYNDQIANQISSWKWEDMEKTGQVSDGRLVSGGRLMSRGLGFV